MTTRSSVVSAARMREVIRFCISGVAGFIVDYGVTSLLSLLMTPYLARVPAFICATLTTWQLNRRYTFKGQTRYKSAIREYVHYTILMLFGLVANYIVYAVTISRLGRSSGALLAGVAFGSIAGLVINYTTSKKIIFSSRP